MNKKRAIDLNAGLGGRVYALKKAGFDIIAAIDIDEENCEIMASWLGKSKVIQTDLLDINPKDIPEVDLIAGKFVQQSYSNVGEKAVSKNVNMTIYDIIAEKRPALFLLEVPVRSITARKYGLDDYLQLFSVLGYRISYRVYDEMNFSGFPMIGKQGYFIGERGDLKNRFDFPNPLYYEAVKKDFLETPESIDDWYRRVNVPIARWDRKFWYNKCYGKVIKTTNIHMGIARENYLVDEIGPRKFTHNEYAMLKGLEKWDYNKCKNKKRMYDKIAYASNSYVLTAIANDLLTSMNIVDNREGLKNEIEVVNSKSKKKKEPSRVIFPKYTLKEMNIKNLKGLKDLSIKFEKNLTALMGVNGAGKSTILHALACAYSPYEKGEDYKFRDFFTPNPDATWKDSCFNVVNYDGNEDKNFSKKFEKKKDRWARYTDRPKRDVYYIGISSCIPEIEQEKQTSFINYVSKKEENKLTSKIIKKASYILNKDYQNLLSHEAKNKKYIGVQTKSGIVYSALSMGAGEQRVIKLLQIIYNANQYSLILIDELDLLLHVDAFRKLIKTLAEIANDKHLQIIFTTHSLEIQELQEFVDIRYIEHKDDSILVYNSIKPDLLYELSGEREKPYLIYVEDEFAAAVVQQIAYKLCMQRYISIITYGSINNAFTLAAGKVIDNMDLKDVLIVLDGDRFVSEIEKRECLKRILTGTEINHNEKIEKALSVITQFNLPPNINPEEYIYSMLISMDASDECVLCARSIKNVSDSHNWIENIVKTMGNREGVYERITRCVSEHEQWDLYVKSIQEWLAMKKKEIEMDG
ncbi:AAA family ATPase [Ruminococcus sp.]|uniref:AAA family ATPase n=1 Tax=Ruminococcus sp. TaxID=41978 RepID=UPI003528276E